MGTAVRGKHPALIQDLLENAPAYEFYQAMQLVEADAVSSRATANNIAGGARLRPAPELSFPAADIRRCSLDANGRLDFELNFSGLYGVDAPLPHFFLDLIAEEDDPGQALRAFLDLFSQRLYQLYYLAWKKFHCHSNLGESSLYERYLKALSGFDTTEIEQSLAYTSLIGSRVKNNQGLIGLLEDFLQLPVTADQYVPCWVQLDSVPALGGTEELALGENALLGSRVLDLSRTILIKIGPISLAQARSLLPGQQGAKELGLLIREYLDPTVLFDIDLEISPESAAVAQLGKQEAILGWTAWLGNASGENSIIHLPGTSFDSEVAR